MNHPDPKLHQSVSFLKSAVRISGYVALFWSVGLGAVILILSEIILFMLGYCRGTSMRQVFYFTESIPLGANHVKL
jgi:hypothetical protein